MPAIKKGYSEKHNQHPNWLYVPAFDCHVRVTVMKNVLGWVVDRWEGGGRGHQKKKKWIGWFMQTNWLYEDGHKLWGRGEHKMYHGKDKDKVSTITPFHLFNALSGSLTESRRHSYSLFKHRGILFVAHYLNGKVIGIGIADDREYSEDTRKVYCYKNNGYYPVLKSNLHLLRMIFEKLDWDIEMRFNWMQMAMSDKEENVALAYNMLQAYFNETNN